MAGGGYANLELYERLGSSPDVTVCTIIGEGSFHQVHGGTTTNQPDPEERRGRGCSATASTTPTCAGGPSAARASRSTTSVASRSDAARRSKARRLSTRAFAEAAARRGRSTGRPTDADTGARRAAVWSFTEAVWRNLAWSGHDLARPAGRHARPPTCSPTRRSSTSVRPDWVVETGTGDGGRALFLASICDLVGHGQVLSIDRRARTTTSPQHPRTPLPARRQPHEPATVDEVRRTVGDEPSAGRARLLRRPSPTRREFEAYAPLVPVGSYVVVADTIVNGHPVWPGFGPGPGGGASSRSSPATASSSPIPSMEKYSLTFNPGGFLRRVR